MTLLCEPNVSEGRDRARIALLADSVRLPGVELIHCSADADHNRMVLAYRGHPDAVVDATTRLAETAIESIDLRDHAGQHPRLGALDVVPFVARRGDPEGRARALAACREFGRRVGGLGVPVFYYEQAASADHRRALPAVRRGGFEGLTEKMSQEEWAPDEGPALPHPTAGAVITGVRWTLVRFNVNLDDSDPAVARAIAREIRESAGGLGAVRALGLELAGRGLSQVTVNLTDYHATSLSTVYAEIAARALEAGVGIAGTEVIGPIPRDALDGIGSDILSSLEPGQILEPSEDENG